MHISPLKLLPRDFETETIFKFIRRIQWMPKIPVRRQTFCNSYIQSRNNSKFVIAQFNLVENKEKNVI